MNYRWIIFLGAILAALGVASGAAGAHQIENRVEKGLMARKQLTQFETAVRYQIYHALGLILIGLVAQTRSSRWLAVAAVTMICGCLLFCGGLYAFVAVKSMQLPYENIVHVVPVGGGLFIVSWLVLAMGVLGKGKSPT
ncbi:MAG: DUF423 domain-containing protein [Planctomycetes bacterium]|nr:DUF423 domain-containing protein [Planctomycetota bacterium]